MSHGADAEQIGQLVLGRYRVARRLAQGGMGVVYLGRLEGAAGFAKPVVIKRIISDPEDQLGSTGRFIREAQILSNLQHPGIVGVLDFGEEDELYSMVLEYVQGYDLGRWLKYLQLKAQTMGWEEAVFIILRVLEALSYAHGFRRNDGTPAEILHRDISPGNILLDVDGRVRLVDFGIARMDASAGDLYKTQTGVLKGKITYMAPELFAGSPPSPASDIYACAIILYQMLAGANPFTSANDSRLMWRVIMEGPPLLARKRDDLPPALLQVLARGYDRDPGRRHASAERFAAELREVLERSEAELGAGLRERLRVDFNGDLPALLRLETLAERDRAWRQDTPAAAPAREPSVPEVPISAPSVTPTTLSGERREPASPADAITARASRPVRRADPALAPVSVRSRGLTWRPAMAMGMAMSVGLGAVMAAALYFMRPPPPPAEARFIVVEAPDPSVARSAPQDPSPVARAGAEQPSKPEQHGATPQPPAVMPAVGRQSAPAATRPGRPPASGSSVALTRAFAQHERELGACFDRHAAELEGQPEIAISFEADASGTVRSAGLVPSSLEGTALGRCLLAVARTVSFGPLGKTTRFTIPIHASASR